MTDPMFRVAAKAALTAFVLVAAGPGAALAEEAGDAGKPLEQYCNTVPDLSVQRMDSVDNWVRICTVWFEARCPKDKDKDKDKTGRK